MTKEEQPSFNVYNARITIFSDSSSIHYYIMPWHCRSRSLVFTRTMCYNCYSYIARINPTNRSALETIFVQAVQNRSALETIFIKQCSEYQIWVPDTSSCSGMKGTTTTMMTGTSRPGDTLSILSSYARARNHTHEYYVLGSEALPKSCQDPSFSSFKRLLVLYHLCYNSFSKTKIVNTAS